uniref:VWA domain-containing protein n=1 Tax=uncultured Alphaproteobacteria bacterium TaxID=91750 RepID=A0A6G8F2Q4_9PROT|nr:VWA domain-containing protein [uncultured Alphaproteobacteria bacterium]
MITVLYPWALLLLFLPFVVRRFSSPVSGLHGDALRVPFLHEIARINVLSGSLWGSPSGEGKSRNWLILYFAWFFLCLAAARPLWVGEPVRISNSGRDILLVTDISNSMREPDFSYQNQRIDRLTAVKLAADGFIRNRPNDRIGLILFGTRAYLQSPVTFDKQAVLDILWSTDAGMAGQSTAIGDAVGLGLKNLRDEKASSSGKVMILLTDGENNDGSLSIPDVLKMAKDENVKIYTIGVGSENRMIGSFFGISVPVTDGLDEESLRRLAAETKGNYFRASDTKGLQRIYQEIDRLEPSLDEEQFVQESKDLFFYPLAAALFIVLMLFVLRKRGY